MIYDKKLILENLSKINSDYQSGLIFDDLYKIIDFIDNLEHIFFSNGGEYDKLISFQEENLLRNINFCSKQGKFSKDSLFVKYYSNINVLQKLNPLLVDKMLEKINEIKIFKENTLNSFEKNAELINICSALNKLIFRIKLPNNKVNINTIIDKLYSFTYKLENLDLNNLKEIILDYKAIMLFLIEEREIFKKQNHFLLEKIPDEVKKYTILSLYLVNETKNDNFQNVYLSKLRQIYNTFIPIERLNYLKNLGGSIHIIEPTESEIKNLTNIQQAEFIKSRIIDLAFGVRMIFLKDYVYDNDKSSLDNYYNLIINSFNRLKPILIDADRL